MASKKGIVVMNIGRQYNYNSRAYNCPFIFTCETGPSGDYFYEGRAMGKEKFMGLSSSNENSRHYRPQAASAIRLLKRAGLEMVVVAYDPFQR